MIKFGNMSTMHGTILSTSSEASIDSTEMPPVRLSDALNIIIPIGGIGSRFASEGYRYPKPLINIVGQPMILRIIEYLNMSREDTLWLAINEDVDDEFRVGQLVKKNFPKLDFRLLRLRHQTKGASETLYVVTQSMSLEHLERRTISLDCDTIYWKDILQHVREMPANHGSCFYFPDDGDKPIFSYIKTSLNDNLEVITDIQEKKAISSKANTGAYVFPSADLLRSWSARTIDTNRAKSSQSEIGEYYTSQMIASMISEGGVLFLGIPLSMQDFSCVGTPQQLKDLLHQLKNEDGAIKIKKRRFCFDLDMTLVGAPEAAGDYSTCPPIWKNIKLVQQLHKAGHYIIIQTARRMKTHNGNVGAVIADIGVKTFAQLAKYNIPFDDIHFGKPYADVYVDDLAVNANLDTMREIGWQTSISGLTNPPDSGSKSCPLAGMITARDFNTIQILGDKVIKSSKSDKILGELFFYAHLPAAISSFFPKVYAVDLLKETATYTISMANCRGLTYSHLLVGRSLTNGRLLSMLRALNQIHTTPNHHPSTLQLEISPHLAANFQSHSVSQVNNHVNIYANYGAKLRHRYSSHRNQYDALGHLATELFTRLIDFLDTFEEEEKGTYTAIIHGDPVFSNVILSGDDKSVTFIDVRCQLGDTLTMEGDIHYDWAKVLQSLMGYDHVLFLDDKHSNDSPSNLSPCAPNEETNVLEQADQNILAELRQVFWDFLDSQYSVKIHKKKLMRITASLFFSLIPLHKPKFGPVFLSLCQKILDQAGEMRHGRARCSVRSHGSERVFGERAGNNINISRFY